jgi:DNA repair protein RadC
LVDVLGRSRSATRTARALLEQFGTFPRVVSAPAAALLKVAGMIPAKVATLKTVEIAATLMLRQRVDDEPRVLCDALDDYLKVKLGLERVKIFRVVFLDSQAFILADEEMARGTIDSAEIYTRKIIRRCLDLDAKAIILAHNHPTGRSYPSPPDLQLTREIVAAAGLFRILVRDHIIVGREGVFSLRQNALMA